MKTLKYKDRQHLTHKLTKFFYLLYGIKEKIEVNNVLLHLENETTFPKYPLMVEVTNDNKFLVSALPEGTNEFSSYIEVLVTEKDTNLYDYFTVSVGALNMAGEGVVITAYGEKYTHNTYCLYSTKEIHEAILNGENIAHIDEGNDE
jgi:hypothetical protein